MDASSSWTMSRRAAGPARLRRLALDAAGLSFAFALALTLAACTTWRAPASFDDAALRARAVTDSRHGARVTAAVLSAEDSRRMFGADVNATGVQPVWVEIRNQTPEPLWLLSPGADPDYFSPHEVAWSMHTPLARAANARIDEHFDSRGFRSPILPDETRAGVLFLNPERRTRVLNIDLLQNRRLIPFSLFLSVPDEAADEDSPTMLYSYRDAEITNYRDLAAMRSALERLPCCAGDPGGTAAGDPINVVFVGDLRDIGAALVRRSYRRDARALDASQLVFGRAPDAVLRKQAQAGAPATWMRAWLAPLRFEGRAVYLVQVGRPVGGRFAPRGATSVLHEDVDEARNLLVQDMMYSGGLDKLGFATGVGPAAPTAPRATVDGARYHTDGLRAVLFLATRPLSLADVELLDWAPYLPQTVEAPAPPSVSPR
jgi:hypothetical protein